MRNDAQFHTHHNRIAAYSNSTTIESPPSLVPMRPCGHVYYDHTVNSYATHTKKTPFARAATVTSATVKVYVHVPDRPSCVCVCHMAGKCAAVAILSRPAKRRELGEQKFSLTRTATATHTHRCMHHAATRRDTVCTSKHSVQLHTHILCSSLKLWIYVYMYFTRGERGPT